MISTSFFGHNITYAYLKFKRKEIKIGSTISTLTDEVESAKIFRL